MGDFMRSIAFSRIIGLSLHHLDKLSLLFDCVVIAVLFLCMLR